MHEKARIRVECLPELLAAFAGKLTFHAKGTYFEYRFKKCGVVEKDSENLLHLCETTLEKMTQILI